MGGTQPMGSSVGQAPNIQSTAVEDEEEEWDEEDVDAGMLPFAILALILAIGVLAIQILTKMSAGA